MLLFQKKFCNFATFFQPIIPVGKFTEFRLPLKTLPEGTHEFEYHLDKQFFVNMESADIRDADLTVKLTVVYKHDMYDLSFLIEGTITLQCARCLDDLEIPVEETYHLTVKYGEDYNDETDELLIIPQSDNYLNVAYMIYDTVSLAVPIKPVHPMGKCNRAMSALLRKHRARKEGDEDTELEDQLIDEMDSMDSAPVDDAPADPRWNDLKKLTDNN